jgi:hypothetical protein
VGEQSLGGIFEIESAEGTVNVTVSNAALTIGSYLDVSGAAGELEINEEGIAGGLSVNTFTLDMPRLRLNAPSIRIELNTRLVEISRAFDLGNGPEQLVLPAGPYLRAAIMGVAVDVVRADSQDALGSLRGDFFLERVDGVTRLAATPLWS